MIIKQVRLSQQAKNQLSRLKGKTGIKIGMSYVDGHCAIHLVKRHCQQIFK